MRILNDEQEALLGDERRVLNDLRVALVEFGAPHEDTATLGESIQQLDELFLLVVVGEFNAGKSAFINALLGQSLLQEGVTPTTTQVQVLRYGAEAGRTVVGEHETILTLPAQMLAEISIVDTPGTNAIIREHELITSQFVPRADLILFVSSSDRPFTESERQFLAQIRDWGKKIVIVINKSDLLQTENDREEVRRFVCENSRALLGMTPEVFLLSARLALQAKQGQPQLWSQSGFEALETYICERLDEQGRLRLKLASPLGTGESLARKYLEVIRGRLSLLEKDFQMLQDVEDQLAVFHEDLQRDFKFRLADVENALYELQQRGDAFFDDTFRLARIADLIGRDRIQQEFEHKVVGDLPELIERKINEVIDWMVEAQLRQWQAVTQHVAERQREHQERLIGGAGVGSFTYDRERLMESVNREARKVVDTFDKNEEARKIAADAQTTVATSLAIEAGAVGLGALVAVLATTAAMDVTGIISAGIVAVLGLFIIPARRGIAKRELNNKIGGMRDRLLQSLTSTFEREVARSQEQIHGAIGPYDRFVRAESGKLQGANDRFAALKKELDRLKGAVETT
jgi:small GTP-binding protein